MGLVILLVAALASGNRDNRHINVNKLLEGVTLGGTVRMGGLERSRFNIKAFEDAYKLRETGKVMRMGGKMSINQSKGLNWIFDVIMNFLGLGKGSEASKLMYEVGFLSCTFEDQAACGHDSICMSVDNALQTCQTNERRKCQCHGFTNGMFSKEDQEQMFGEKLFEIGKIQVKSTRMPSEETRGQIVLELAGIECSTEFHTLTGDASVEQIWGTADLGTCSTQQIQINDQTEVKAKIKLQVHKDDQTWQADEILIWFLDASMFYYSCEIGSSLTAGQGVGVSMLSSLVYNFGGGKKTWASAESGFGTCRLKTNSEMLR